MIAKGRREDAPWIKDAASRWADCFKACGDAGMRGFQPRNLTPYAHMLKDHAPYMIADVGGLGRFGGEKLEKVNDDFKQTYHR